MSHRWIEIDLSPSRSVSKSVFRHPDGGEIVIQSNIVFMIDRDSCRDIRQCQNCGQEIKGDNEDLVEDCLSRQVRKVLES